MSLADIVRKTRDFTTAVLIPANVLVWGANVDKAHNGGSETNEQRAPEVYELSEAEREAQRTELEAIRDPLTYEKPRQIEQPTIFHKEEINKDNYKTSSFSTDNDETLLARMIFGEARGESYTEKVAVGFTAVNRANDGKRWNGETVRESILAPYQYSCFNSNDENRDKLMDPQIYDASAFYNCLDVARDILSGNVEDPTNGATHYFNPELASPSWASKIERIGKIETEQGLSRHEFYRE